MSKLSGIEHVPVELFDEIMKHLVLAVGIYRAVAVRLVNRRFDAAIMHAICSRRVVDVQDYATPALLEDMSPAMRAKVFLQPPRPTDSDIQIYMSVVATTNQALDSYYTSDDDRARRRRHQITAENICIPNWRGFIDFGIPTWSLELEIFKFRRYHSNGMYETDWMKQPDLKDANIEAQNLLSAAVLSGDITIVDTILKSESGMALSPTQARWTPFFCRPLTLAAATGNLKLVAYLLKVGFRLDLDEGIDLVADDFANSGTLSGVDFFRRRHDETHSDTSETRSFAHDTVCWSDIGLYGNHPLSAAVYNGHTDVVRLLLRDEHRLPVDNGLYLKAVLAGALSGRSDLIELLLGTIQCSVADIDNLGLMLVYQSVKSGNVAMVATLEKWGIDLNQPLLGPQNPDLYERDLLFDTQMFSSALQIASYKGDLPMIEFLLLRRPDVNYGHSRYKKPAIEFAAQRGHLKAVRILLEYGADPSSALFGASSTGQLRLIKYLLDRYPSIVDRDYEKAYRVGSYVTGQRAFFLATKACHLAAMTMLVQAGANPSHGQIAPMSRLNLPTGIRPIEEAKNKGQQWVVDHLVSLGLKENVLDKDLKDYGHEQDCCNGIRASEHTWQWMSEE